MVMIDTQRSKHYAAVKALHVGSIDGGVDALDRRIT